MCGTSIRDPSEPVIAVHSRGVSGLTSKRSTKRGFALGAVTNDWRGADEPRAGARSEPYARPSVVSRRSRLPGSGAGGAPRGPLFCLVSGNMDIAQMTQAFLDALPKIERAAKQESVGFWHVYRDRKLNLKRMWP